MKVNASRKEGRLSRGQLASKWAVHKRLRMRWNCLGVDLSLNALFPLLNFSIYLHSSRYFIQDAIKGTCS
jgi:hypothetical protein